MAVITPAYPRFRKATLLLSLLCSVVCSPSTVQAQDPPPPIGPVVLDLRASLPELPDAKAVADSRGLVAEELPGRGIGLDFAVHAYPFRIGIVTIGVGAQLTVVRSHSAPEGLREVTGRFTSFAPQLSLNFGSGEGWSYISGGPGVSRLSLIPAGEQAESADQAWVGTFNYGGGARWFVGPRLAFHFDLRMHSANPGPAQLTLPGSPRTNLLITSVGVSLK